MGKRCRLSFSQHLFISAITIYLIFAAGFLFYQYHREKAHRVEMLEATLTTFNAELYGHMADPGFSISAYSAQYAKRHRIQNLRVSIIDSKGWIVYDSHIPPGDAPGNHSEREEIREAKVKGSGQAIKRTSETLGKTFFYSAQYFPKRQLFVRSALPYDANLAAMLQADNGYLWFAFLLSCILLLVFYNLTARLGAMVSHLHLFARRADQDETIDEEDMEGMGNDELGQISRHIADIYTRMRKAKDELFREREKLIAHLQISHEGLAIFNPGRDVVLSNGLFIQYLNLISDKKVGNVEEAFQVRELQPLYDFINTPQATGFKPDFRQKRIVVDKNGYVFSLTVTLFVDDSFEISVQDITRQEKQNRMKQQITQNMAHELKTPVSGIQGYLETIINNPDIQPEMRDKFLQRCFAQSNRLTNLLRDISVLTRMTEAGQMMEVTEVDLPPLIRHIVTELALKTDEKRMSVEMELPKRMVIQGNHSLLDSIFRNLLDNAIAYAGEGTHVKISCYLEDDDACYFSFSDDGTGVPPEHLGRLFERFYRVDKGRSRKLGGTGLGLAIVKNAVLFHGGNIYARPSSGSHGLEFLFTLKKKNNRSENQENAV